MRSSTEKCSVSDAATDPRPALLVFADDWGRHPSSCQHLVRQLLDRYTVYWVNTIGTRTPRLDLATLRRGLEKVRHWARPAQRAEALPANLHVLNPRMWPWFTSRFDRVLNRRMLLHQLTPLLRTLPEPPVAVATLPIVADLIGPLPVRRWVYYCVDDFGQWPGLDQVTLQHMEARLLARADRVIAVSDVLQDRLAWLGRSAPLLTHGVDLDFWTAPNGQPAIPGLEGVERPLVVFWGVLDRRMDVAFVRQLAADLREGMVVLAGPSAEHDPALDELPRVRRLGALPFEQLPHLAGEAAALVMPYADLPVTRAIQPLKLKEYLATGRPVIVRDLPATRAWADCLDLAATPEAFSEAVRRRLATGLPPEQEGARARLAGESWAAKAQELERWALDTEATAAAV
jgi:glycosyltransferase involved in cell wall biosynthesis